MKSPTIRLEDGTEVIDTTGDLDAFEHGGGVLYRDPKRRHLYWQFWDARESGEKNYLVHTAPIPDDGVLEFFGADFNELCKFAELDRQEVRRLSRSKNPIERLQIVVAIRDVHGPSAIDPAHNPEVLTPWELAARWGSIFGSDPSDIPQVDYEDFIVRDTKYGDYECGCVDGTYLGRHKSYKYALCAIADFMEKFGTARSNVFHEHEAGQLELVNWERKGFVGKIPKRRGKLPVAPWKNAMKRYVTSEIKRKAIARRSRSQKDIMKERKRKAAKVAQGERIERARALRRSAEEIHRR